ncbi:1-acyl-sn-glycerol-3-phosphate acyltransferase [Geodermatophilus saharensis]|uniref:1-acyl-sn-glycerol-3-phosphate acyltransferase n=1 Tax=Geodermatophilus saharensis TaxID=1137994 RepID=A0A239J7K2_9ACTN|nr:1-acyl-sn-glycerol-3-phosphate acyltransferase [Geodermatophilus saharensis]SNT01986.1 1-acyl-sn-glycerol-3-phosphate acyltransferase [Geodermatophilus saharensis]
MDSPTAARPALTPVLARTAVRAATATWGGDRRRQRLRVRTAAELLCARGLRVRVVPSPLAWPRGPRLVVANAAGWTDVLALATVVPGTPVVDADLVDTALLRSLTRRGGLLVDDGTGAVRGEVAELLRRGATVTAHPGGAATDGEPGRFRARALAAAVDARAPVCPVAVRHADGDRVVEVHLLPALQPGADPRPLAALAEYAVAHVLEAGGTVPVGPAPGAAPSRRRRTVRARAGYGRGRP